MSAKKQTPKKVATKDKAATS
ncbi:MAG: hypothetical protein RL153_661, partial [Verrucomicrobiota bacterium]